MSDDLYWLGIAFGFFIEWNLNSFCFHLAYRFGIVEYKGLKK